MTSCFVYQRLFLLLRLPIVPRDDGYMCCLMLVHSCRFRSSIDVGLSTT